MLVTNAVKVGARYYKDFKVILISLPRGSTRYTTMPLLEFRGPIKDKDTQ